MKTVHRYSSGAQFHFWFYNLMAYFFLGLGLFSVLRSVFKMEIDQVLISLLIIFAGLLQLFYAHFCSEIISDDGGLLVRFCFWPVRVDWDDVIEIKPATKVLLLNTIRNYYLSATFIVKTRALTPFHRFYGLYISSFQPSFVIFSNISGFDDLHSSIQHKKLIRKNERLEI